MHAHGQKPEESSTKESRLCDGENESSSFISFGCSFPAVDHMDASHGCKAVTLHKWNLKNNDWKEFETLHTDPEISDHWSQRSRDVRVLPTLINCFEGSPWIWSTHPEDEEMILSVVGVAVSQAQDLRFQRAQELLRTRASSGKS